MSISQVIPPFADNVVPITNATASTVGQPGQILVGILVISSTAGTITLSSPALGTICTALPLTAGQFLQLPLVLKGKDQLSMTGGGTFVATMLFQNP